MNKFIKVRAFAFNQSLVLLLFLGLFFAAPAGAQESRAAAPAGAEQQGAGNQGGELVRRLQLTPEQIARIRMIREGNREERRQTMERLRSAQRALDEAIYADNPSEAVIEERSRELAEAQVAAARLRALTELGIRRVLTPEQLDTLRSLRQRQSQMRLERELNERNRLRNRHRLDGGGDTQPVAPRNRYRLRANYLEQPGSDSRNDARERRREMRRQRTP